MAATAIWPVLAMVVIAAITDLRSRRIPNWLVLPFIAAGPLVSLWLGGFGGLGQSIAGIAMAVLLMGLPVFLGGMGMGDLKLCAAVGAWVGPAQLVIALVVTGVVGGAMAVTFALYRGRLGESLDGVGDLVSGRRKLGGTRRMTLSDPAALKIPYAPAIAIGTVFSFFTN